MGCDAEKKELVELSFMFRSLDKVCCINLKVSENKNPLSSAYRNLITTAIHEIHDKLWFAATGKVKCENMSREKEKLLSA